MYLVLYVPDTRRRTLFERCAADAYRLTAFCFANVLYQEKGPKFYWSDFIGKFSLENSDFLGKKTFFSKEVSER